MRTKKRDSDAARIHAQASSLVEVVRQIKSALIVAGLFEDNSPLEVTKVELEIKTALTKAAGGRLNVSVLTAGAQVTSNNVQTIHMTLTPEAAGGDMVLVPLKHQFVRAFQALRDAIFEAADVAPPFTLEEGVVTLEFFRTTQGTLSVVVSADRSSEATHKAKVFVRSRLPMD